MQISSAIEAKPQLSLSLACNAAEQTVLRHRYMAYPLSVSPLFRREENNLGEDPSRRAYLYRINTSPGLLAGDRLDISLRLTNKSQLYLVDQSATKVHKMPEASDRAEIRYELVLLENSTLEFLPEPLILFEDSQLAQTIRISMHEEAALCLGEIVLPGRLARGEYYQFRSFLNKMEVRSPGGKLWFAETMKLTGKGNRFAQSPLFVSAPVLGTLILVLPSAIATSKNLSALSAQIDALEQPSLSLASSILPSSKGLFVRAMSDTTRELQSCFRQALSYVRELRGQNPLPYGL